MNRTIKTYPAFDQFYGSGRNDRTNRWLLSSCRAGTRGAQADSVLARPGRWRQEFAGRRVEEADAEPSRSTCCAPATRSVRSLKAHSDCSIPRRWAGVLEDEYGIPRRRLTGYMSPWAIKRLDEFGGDISKFSVVRVMPSEQRRCCVAKTEPGDENNQDISSLVGKVDIRKLEHFSQDDADAYSYTGGLNRTTQGLLEFVEMFKAPLKMLHPLLTATQDGTYVGTENVGAMPYQGIIVAHSNESEWESFKANRSNEAFLDRICVVKVPYCLRVTEETDDLRQADPELEAGQRALRPGHAGNDGPILGVDAAEGTRELQPVLQDAGLRRRVAQGHRPHRADRPGIPRRRRA